MKKRKGISLSLCISGNGMQKTIVAAKNSLKIVPILICLIIGWGVNTNAVENVQAEKTVVTATRTEISETDVPASVEIITAEEISRIEGTTITDILKYATSIGFYSDMLRSTPSIRGLSGKHTLLLMDGKRMAGPQGKFNETDRITLENVQRIEIIRGPMSTLYGSEAMGGVINIITRKPETMSARAGVKYSGYDSDSTSTEAYFDLTLGGEKMGKFGVNLSGEIINGDPLMTDNDTSLTPDKELKSISGKLTCDVSEFITSTFTLGYTEDEVDNDQFSTYLRSSDNEYDRLDLSLGFDYNTPELKAMIRGYYSDYDKEYESRYRQDYLSKGTQHTTGELIDFDSGERETSVVEGQVSKLFSKKHLVTLGGEWRREFYHSARMDTGEGNYTSTREGVTVEGSECEPDNYALYLQDEWSIGDKLLIIPGLRYDEPDDFDSEISPKLGITWFMRPDLRLKLNYGHSYVAPGPGELYKDWYGMGGRYHIIGNKDLDPEVSDSYEIAIEGEKGRFGGRVAYFYNDITDLIESMYSSQESASVKAYVYQNIGKAEIQGTEVEAYFNITKDLMFKATYAYLDAMDKEADERLEQRAKNTVTAKLFYTNPRYDVDINLWGEHTMDYLENDKNYDFTVVNLNIKKRLNQKTDLYVGVNNLLDEKEEELHDMLLGAQFYGGVNFKF